MTDEPRNALRPEPKIDTTVPHSARIWNYWLGGKDHYEVDRIAGDEYVKTFPGIVDIARQSRYYLARVVRFLVNELGVRQFLDVGTGLPTVDNTHEVAQRAAPDARVVYVDNDPLVLAHARALLTSTAEGVTEYVDADLREPGVILREAARTLDLTRPVGLMLMEILGHVTDDQEARSIVRRLLGGLASGSYLVICDGTTAIPGNSRMPSISTTRPAPSPTSSAARSRSPGSSRASSCWSLGSSRACSGGPRLSRWDPRRMWCRSAASRGNCSKPVAGAAVQRTYGACRKQDDGSTRQEMFG